MPTPAFLIHGLIGRGLMCIWGKKKDLEIAPSLKKFVSDESHDSDMWSQVHGSGRLRQEVWNVKTYLDNLCPTSQISYLKIRSEERAENGSAI